MSKVSWRVAETQPRPLRPARARATLNGGVPGHVAFFVASAGWEMAALGLRLPS